VSRAFAIFVNTFFQGAVPTVLDEYDNPCVFATRVMAEREIVDNMMTHLQQFIDGEREFEDATTLEEYVVEVDVLPDGSIIDPFGNRFGARCDS
jgi:hypothetical protein